MATAGGAGRSRETPVDGRRRSITRTDPRRHRRGRQIGSAVQPVQVLAQPRLCGVVTRGHGLLQPPPRGPAAFLDAIEQREIGVAAAADRSGGLRGPAHRALHGERIVPGLVSVHAHTLPSAQPAA